MTSRRGCSGTTRSCIPHSQLTTGPVPAWVELSDVGRSILAKSDDNNPLTRWTNQNDLGSDWGPSNGDRRHSLVASGAFLLPFDVTLAAVWTFRSSLPFSALAGLDFNGHLLRQDARCIVAWPE